MTFPEPSDEFTITRRGTVRATFLPRAMTWSELQALVGQTVQLGSRAYKVAGVETYALAQFSAGSKIGLLGEWV